jgi:hypothetical protein
MLPPTADRVNPPPRLRSVDHVNLDRLLRLRVVVARMGEMDRAQWWNTQGQLGPFGASAVRRGLRRTHYFAQARSVFAVAAHRCAETFDPRDAVTLWRLPDHVEEAFDARWESWLDTANDWESFFERVAAIEGTDIVPALEALGLADGADLASFAGLHTSAAGRAVALPATFAGTDAEVTLLALGFARGAVGSLAVPYAHVTAR